MTATATAIRQIDVRTIIPPHRHPTIFQAFEGLQAGERIELVNDHDPRPLRLQFDARVPGQYAWQYLEQGPVLWRVAITRTRAADATAGEVASEGGCCGGCCGGA